MSFAKELRSLQIQKRSFIPQKDSFIDEYISIYLYSDNQHCCPRGVMVKAMDCGTIVSEFVLHSRYYLHIRAIPLGKVMNPLILPAMGLIVPLLFLLGEWLWH